MACIYKIFRYFCAQMHDPAVMVQNVFKQVRNNLCKVYNAREARQLALILFDHYAGIGAKELIVFPQAAVEDQTVKAITQAAERLLLHEPIQYITGIAHFCGYEFRVNPDVLIPRPETEELVRWILEDHAGRHNLKIADIGTGSGCIAISLWLRFQDAAVDAFDFSEAALDLAKQNNDELGSKVNFIKMDFLNRAVWPAGNNDIIVSNPPYIPEKNKGLIPENVAKFEPASALFVPDDDPLIFYRALADFALSHLKSHGSIFVEVHEEYADSVFEFFSNTGFSRTELKLDFNRKKRMIKASK